MANAFIYDAVRTPRGRGKTSGSLHTIKAADLLVTALEALRTRNELDTSKVDDVTIGCVTQVQEQGACIARTAVLLADWDETVAGVTVNRFCGSGLEAVNEAAAKVASGFFDCAVGGGVESMSRVKMGSDGGAIWDPEVSWKFGTVPQGISADLMATRHGVTREQVDRFALHSQMRATHARETGLFGKSIVPVKDRNGLLVLDRDEFIRPESTLVGLGKLNASFEMMGTQFGLDAATKYRYPEIEYINHIHTAGNSSGIVDGAAAVLVGNETVRDQMGLEPRARIVSMAVIGHEPVIMLEGPLPASERALKKAGMTAKDIDLFEVNEAFAVVPLVFANHFDIELERINVNGGAIALGHPLGATGAMLLGTLLDALEERNLNTGLVTLCIGGGMGIATIIERV